MGQIIHFPVCRTTSTTKFTNQPEIDLEELDADRYAVDWTFREPKKIYESRTATIWSKKVGHQHLYMISTPYQYFQTVLEHPVKADELLQTIGR